MLCRHVPGHLHDNRGQDRGTGAGYFSWGCAVSPAQTMLYRDFDAKLSDLLEVVSKGDTVLASEITDRATAERLVGAVGAVVYLHEHHPIDAHGRRALCWQPPRRWWCPWPRRSICLVHVTLSMFLPRPAQ